MTSVYSMGASFINHATPFSSQRADNLGFKDNVNGKKAIETRALKDTLFPRFSFSPNLSSAEQISLFKEFAGWDTEENKFPDGFDINAAIRRKEGQDIRWLDVLADAKAKGKTTDENFTRFLLENGASLDDCLPETKSSLQALAADVGYQAVGTIPAEEIQGAVRTIRNPRNSADNIQFLINIGNINDPETASPDNSAGFLGRLDLNAPIRKQGGKEYTLLDLAAEISDKKLALFLIEKDAIQCSADTKTTFATEFQLDALKRANAAPAQASITSLPSTVGSTNSGDINDAAATVNQRSLGGYLSRLKNPRCLAAVVAGGSLYAASVAVNTSISIGYVMGQGFASMAVMPSLVADEAISAGINLVRTSVGYEKMDTRYYLTKTFGGLACLTALGAVAIFAANPASYAIRFALSHAADLGADLISYGLEGDQTDKTIRDQLKNINHDYLNQHMKKENRQQLGTLIGDLATKRGFGKSVDGSDSGLTSPMARLAMVPIILYP